MILVSANTSAWPLARHPLALAFCLSVVLHGLVYGGYRVGRRLNWEGPSRLVAKLMQAHHAWLASKPKAKLDSPLTTPPKKAAELAQREPPLLFVAVDPIQATTEAPKEAKYYSDKNSLAGNPDPKEITGVPRIDGTQDKVMRTMDVPKPKPAPLQPTPPPEPAPPPPKEERKPPPAPKSPEPEIVEAKPKPAGGQAMGDLAFAKPADRKNPGEGKAESDTGNAIERVLPRPRTVAEAKARLQNSVLAGQKMRQDGGVNRRLEFSALDAKATPFGAYDAAIVAAIQQCWYDLLESNNYAGDRRGRVVLEFRLHSNGRISDMTCADNTVGDLLGFICQRAVEKPSPYEKWPEDMRKLFGTDYREVRFTFYYE